MSSTQPAVDPFVLSTRILAGSLMSALVVIGVALAFVLPLPHGGGTSAIVLAAQGVAGVLTHLLLEAVGYRTPPLGTELGEAEAAARSRTRWQSLMVLRFAIAEAVAIASVALAFVLPDGDIVTYAGGAAVSLVLMAVHVWPWSRPVGRTADALESGGRLSGLREAFGLVAPGAIRRL